MLRVAKVGLAQLFNFGNILILRVMNIRPFVPAQLPPAPRQLIEASAGTGKTYSITSLYLRFVLEQELGVDKILVLSFTEAATAELHERIRTRLQAAITAYQRGGDHNDSFLDELVRGSANRNRELLLLRKALAEIDQAAVTTIHSFCRRILQQGAFESGMPFDLELVSAVDDFNDELIYDFLAEASHRDDPRLLALFRRGYGLRELRLLVREAVRHRYFPVEKGEKKGKEDSFVFSLVPLDCQDSPDSPGSPDSPDSRDFQDFQESKKDNAIPLLLAAANYAFSRARQSWQENQEEIVASLRGAGFVKKYRELIADGMIERLTAYLVGSRPNSFLVPPGTEILTPLHFADPDSKICTKTAGKKGNIPHHYFFTLWREYLVNVQSLATAYRLSVLTELIDFSRRELPRRLVKAGVQSFDDLLYGLEQALRGPGGTALVKFIANRYPVALVDEFQDTDPVQYAIFQAVYGENQPEKASVRGGHEHKVSAEDQRRLILIGDPKQAIYGFRGADIFAYLRAKQDCADQHYTMTVNWRADKGMVSAINALFAGVSTPFVVPGIDFPKVTARPEADDLWRETGSNSPLQFLIMSSDLVAKISADGKKQPARTKVLKVVPDLVADDIGRLLAGDGSLAQERLRPADIAVLVRSNQQAAEIQDALERLGVKATLHSRASVLQSAEAEQLAVVLHGLLDQAGEARRRAAMITDLLAFDHTALKALKEDEKTWRLWAEAFNRWRLLWRERGFMIMIRAIFEERAVAPRLLARPDGQRRLTNFRHLVELLHGHEREGHLQAAALVKWLDEGIAGRRPSSEAEELRLESDEDAVQVLTIHRSKGLEYPVVYCPYLWLTGSRQKKDGEDFFSYHEQDEQWLGKIVLFPDEQQRQLRRWEQFAEELRLLYVALTRARHCCRIVWAGAGGYGESALAYLLHGNDRENLRPVSGNGDSADANAQPRVAPTFNLTYDEALTLLQQRVEAEPTWGLQTLAEEARIHRAISPNPDLSRQAATVRRMQNVIDRSWRVGSFSHLTAQAAEHVAAWAKGTEDRDRDYDAISLGSGLVLPATDLADAAAQAAKLDNLAIQRLTAPVTLANFPAGARAGNLLHKIMETISFADASRHQAIIDEQLRAFGFNREEWRPQLRQALSELLITPLLKSNPWCLADITDKQRLKEMAFVFPLRQQGKPLQASRLAAVFAEFPTALPATYPEQLARLPFPAIQGYLKGFVDLICRWRNKWYIIDYKSNLLGASYADYQAPKLAAPMSAHHYNLQYHIYAVALHRHLTLCLPNYDYDSHFGGVLYLFMRGMHQELGPNTGVYFELPPKDRIEALSGLLANTTLVANG